LPADAKDLRILASAVAEIDAAGVQLLLSLARTMQSRGGRLELVDASPGLCAAIEALGVADLLDSTPTGAAHAQ
jgi:anti-anti-sigma regulatory factor